MSILLDLVRGGAALIVLFGHAGWLGLMGPNWWFDDSLQHAAVVVFFVLSGLMIQQSATREGMTLQRYAGARAARILPVSIFSVLFSTAMFLSLTLSGHLRATSSQFGHLDAASVIPPLLFLSAGLNGTGPVLNPPYWSLCYEVWFYILFGFWTFLRGWRRRGWIALAAIMAGPPILLLLPIWLFGVLVGSGRLRAPVRLAGPAFLLGLAGFLLFSGFQIRGTVVDLIGRHGINMNMFGFSGYVLTDIAGGLFVALALAALRELPGDVTRLRPIARWVASCSFTLYLTHWPVLVLLRTFRSGGFSIGLAIAAIVVPVALAAMLAPYIEGTLSRRLRDAGSALMRHAGRWPVSPRPKAA